MTAIAGEPIHTVRIKPCEMVKPYPRIDACGQPTSKGWRGAKGNLIPICPSCVSEPRFEIAEHRLEPL